MMVELEFLYLSLLKMTQRLCAGPVGVIRLNQKEMEVDVNFVFCWVVLLMRCFSLFVN